MAVSETQPRSKFPDLVFPDFCQPRVNQVASLVTGGKGISVHDLMLDRATVFVTHRCNLRCIYCNGPHLDPALSEEQRRSLLEADLPQAVFARLLSSWQEHHLRYIHFTGGEPTLHPELLEFVRLAKTRGMIPALTTNGQARPELYRRLIEAGLYELRVSLDTGDAAVFDETVGVRGAFARAQAAVREITRLRDEEGKDVFLIFNVTVGAHNLAQIETILDRLFAYGPNDIKLLVIAEQRENVTGRADRATVERILAAVEAKRPQFSLLQDKVKHLFRRNQYGLKDLQAKYLMRQCFVPLTERTLDGRGLYPCSIYLRCHGEPIAPADLDFEAHQAHILEFIAAHRCQEDAICREHCLRCTREFNLQVNKRIRDLSQSLGEDITVAAVEEERLLAAEKALFDILAQQPLTQSRFLIIKPFGLAQADEITAYLREQVGPFTPVPIKNWHDFSLFLYLPLAFKQRIPRERLAYNQAYRSLEGNEALLLLLSPGVPQKKLKRLKSEIREWLGEEQRRVTLPDGSVHLLKSNALHVPEEENLVYELQVAKHFLPEAREW